MIARLNLASNPFRNRTLPWAIAVVISCVSLLALVYVVAESRRTNAEADVAEQRVTELRKERADLKQQAEEIRQNIPADQLRTLEAAHLLVDRKSFSWSQLFSDLEAALPSSVRVSRINVREVFKRGEQTRADLDLTVVGRNAEDVTNMISDMTRLGAFSAIPVSESQKSGKGESGFEFALRVSYVQNFRRTQNPEGSADGTASITATDSLTAQRRGAQEDAR